jgi:hypothetical protein
MRKVATWMSVVLCGVVMLSGLPWAVAIEGTPIKVHADAGVSVTDNRDSADDARKESNVDAFVRGRFEFLMDWESALLDLYYAPRYRYRADPSTLQESSEWQHEVNLIGQISPVDRFTLRVQERYNYTDDPTVDDADTTLRRDISYLMNRLDVLAALDITQTLKASVDVAHMMKRYDNDLVAARADEDRLTVGLNARQSLSQTTSLKARVALQSFELEDYNASDGTLTLPRSFDAIQVGLGIEQAFSPRLVGSVMAGIQSADYEDDALDDNTEPFAKAVLVAVPTETFKLRGQVTHMLVNAYAYPFSSQKHTSLYGSAEWDVTSALVLAAGLEYRLADYDEDSVNPAIPDVDFPKDRNGNTDTFVGTLGATVNVTPSTAVQVAYSLEDVDSDVFTTFTRNAGTVSVSQEF